MIPMRSNVAIKITKKKERMKPFTRKHFFYDVKIMRGTAAVYGVFVTIFSLPTHLFFVFFLLVKNLQIFGNNNPRRVLTNFFCMCIASLFYDKVVINLSLNY